MEKSGKISPKAVFLPEKILRIYVDSCIPGGSHIGPDREGGDLPDKEVSERARRLEDHARGRQPQPQDQRHHPRASDGSNQVEAKLSTKYNFYLDISAKYKNCNQTF